jgi:O-methyltransferase
MEPRLPAEPHPGLAAARAVRAVGPAPGAEELRSAYLELLKLCLCDLGGARTISVGRTEDGLVMSRELSGDGLRLRAAGMDWPLQGLTMIGLDRLDDLQACVEAAVADGVDGDLIEAGAWRGGASLLMRATLDSLGERGRTVWVADSFQGFPDAAEAEGEREDLAPFDFLSVPLEEVTGYFERYGCRRGVRFVPGFFAETMPALRGRRWSLLRLDGDTYEATMVTLEALYPGLSRGGHVIVDDYGALEECRRAVDDFRRAQQIEEPLEEVDWTCVRWRRKSEPSPAEPAAGPVPGYELDGTGAAPAGARRQEARIPTMHEIEVERELGRLRERLEAVEAELARLRGSRLHAAAAWLQRRTRRGR